MLWALSNRVSEPRPTKNLGLKYFENGILKFSGPHPRSMVLGFSVQPFNPAPQAQKRVSVVCDLKDRSVILHKYLEFSINAESPKRSEKIMKRTAKPIK